MTDALEDTTVISAKSRKPRLVLMGEFSAGKSTLSNILLDSAPLPMRVTATRLPPVQISYGPPAAYAVGLDGTREPVALDALETVSLDETLMIELYMEADALHLCDLVDMPGISDPNMPHELWENIIEENDRVIWCTHATQAWRQSEAAIWSTLQPKSSGENLLLITQFDKLRNDRDKDRVLRRVKRETSGMFEAVYPVSLLSALDAGDDADAWDQSGAAAFSEHIIKILLNGNADLPPFVPTDAQMTCDDIRDTAALRAFAREEPVAPVRVVPRRVSTGRGAAAHARPAPDQVTALQR